MCLQKADRVTAHEFTGLTEVPREVELVSIEADHELFESLVLRLQKATRVSVLLLRQIDATLLHIR